MEENLCKINDIKSIYILKRIFSCLYNKKFLYLLRHNKALQKRVTINIEDYKREKKRYIVGEKNGFGKEFSLDTNILLFEGEYINRIRNGKGKEYHENGVIKFEGEYLKGKKIEGKGYDEENNIILILERNGKRKEYYKDNIIKFEGEYLNEKRWNGKGYNPSGILEYELTNGKGYVKEFNYKGEYEFEGEYLYGEKNGKGKEFYKEKVTNYNPFIFYSQEQKNIKKSEYKLAKLKFEGNYMNGERNGFGKEYYFNGKIQFEGEYLKGKKWNVKGYNTGGNEIFEIKNGKGHIKEYTAFGKLIFEGEYLNGERSGQGIEYYEETPNPFVNNNIKFKGEYLYGQRNGKGIEYYKGEVQFQGEYLSGKRNGIGTTFYNNGQIKLISEYLNGEIIGNSKEFSNNELIFEGEYLNFEYKKVFENKS